MTKYVNDVPRSNILEIYTSKNEITVCFKTTSGMGYKVFSVHQVVYFLNKANNIMNNKGDILISENVKQGIIRDIEGIYKEEGQYVYRVPSLLPEEQYKKLFKNERAIQFDLNGFISDTISKNSQLKERFQEILELDPSKGVCHALNYFIVLAGLKGKKDFSMLFQSNNTTNKQSLIGYLSSKGKKEQTYQLFMLLVLSQCLPALNNQNVKRREGYSISDECLVYKHYFQFDPIVAKQTYIDSEKFKDAVEGVKAGHYIELAFRGITEYENDNYDSDCSHSMLIYKAENNMCIFIDPSEGVTGLASEKETASLTLEELHMIVEASIVNYANSIYIKKGQSFPCSCDVFIKLEDATLVLDKSEKFYDTERNPSSKIMEISVNKETNELFFTPVIP